MAAWILRTSIIKGSATRQKQAIVDEVSKLLEENYIFPEVSKKIGEQIRTRLKNGDYDKLGRAREFAEAISQDLLAVGKDKHMGFVYAPERAAEIRRLQSRSEDEAKAARERRQLASKASDPRQKAEYEWITSGLDAKANPVRVEPKVIKTYAGVYGDRKVTFENGSLYHQRTGPKYRLSPMTRTLFAVEGLDNFRVEFVVKDSQAVELVGLYDDGGRQPSPRTT